MRPMAYRIHFCFFVFVSILILLTACAPEPKPIPTPAPSPRPITTPQGVITVARPVSTATATVTPTAIPRPEIKTASPEQTLAATSTPTPIPSISFLQQYINNLDDLSRLPIMDHSIATQFSSRNWVALEHYFDWFIDDGNFTGPNYGYIDLNGKRVSYRMVDGYDGKPEYEIVPRTQGPGAITRIWFAHQLHVSINNPRDMSNDEEWSNWGNLGEVGNIRFYFDDEPTPRINFGIKDLFVGKNPFPAPLAAFYVSADGGNINYVPIPFQHSIRVTTTGRPRMMQIQVKQFSTDPSPSIATLGTVGSGSNSAQTGPIQSFPLNLAPNEQAALDQAAQAWQTCTPTHLPDFKLYDLSIPHNHSGEIDLDQPGTMAGLRVRVPRGMADSVWMQVFWDGELQPSMTASLVGMFSTSEKMLPYRSLPLGFIDSLSEHLFYINFPMPFQSARIVFLNERAETLPLTVEIALRDTIPGTENARLHAFYGTRRVERRTDDSGDYVAIDVKGQGKYLGMILNAWELDRAALNGVIDEHWRFPYLESNVDVWTDDRLALPGTGIEDDFNASYYYVFAGYPNYNTKYCLAGMTLLDYSTNKEPSSQYRFYLNDAPEFKNHLQVLVQHGNKGNNLSVTYSSTVFWYQVR